MSRTVDETSVTGGREFTSGATGVPETCMTKDTDSMG